MADYRLIHGDCPAALKELADDSVDAVVTDPPYDLTVAEGRGFMGKAWDGTGIAFRIDLWREVLRVLKPGGHVLAFGGTRTYHRMTVAIEDAGFEVRDCIQWLYGSGFPKSHDISKAIDKAAGAERTEGDRVWSGGQRSAGILGNNRGTQQRVIYDAPATDAAQQWDGWGTALKPAHEPIVLARKPLDAPTIAAQVLATGTGALNIAATRVGNEATLRRAKGGGYDGGWQPMEASGSTSGRWPSNLVLSHSPGCQRVGVKRVQGNNQQASDAHAGREVPFDGGWQRKRADGYADADGLETVEAWECVEGCPVAALDSQAGERPGMKRASLRRGATTGASIGGHGRYGTAKPQEAIAGYDDNGSNCSRFFPVFAYEDDDFVPFLYCAKASRREREQGLEGMETREVWRHNQDGRDPTNPRNVIGAGAKARVERGEPAVIPSRNHHPTVKPIALCAWLCRLITPPGGVVLDPFMGSGSVGCAALREGFRFIGIDAEAEYVEIARARLAWTATQAQQQRLVV